MALSMIGTSFPADVGLTGLFDGFALTASTVDEFSYARELFGDPVEHEGYPVYKLGDGNFSQKTYALERKLDLDHCMYIPPNSFVTVK